MTILLTDAVIATLQGGYGLIAPGAVAIHQDRIAWVGPQDAIPAEFQGFPRHPCGGRLLTPGLIDCHSHAIWAGTRAGEFEARLNGALAAAGMTGTELAALIALAPGTAVWRSASSITWRAVTFLMRAEGLTISRCASVGSARYLTSSGST